MRMREEEDPSEPPDFPPPEARSSSFPESEGEAEGM